MKMKAITFSGFEILSERPRKVLKNTARTFSFSQGKEGASIHWEMLSKTLLFRLRPRLIGDTDLCLEAADSMQWFFGCSVFWG